MNLKDKKFIPYYILGAIIIVLSVVIVVLIANLNSDSGSVEIETTTIPEFPSIFMNGEVPYYENVPVSSLDSALFAYNDYGRMEYSDSDVKFCTGIDVSSHQGQIDWKKVAEDSVDFAILRAGYRGYGSSGIIGEDSLFRENARNALDAGLKIGVYFYSQAITPEEAIEEAEFVLDIIRDYEIEYPVVFDWENDPDIGMRTDNLSGYTLTQCAVAFCERIKSEGYTPAVYFNLSDAYDRYHLESIKDYVFWYAQYKGSSPLFYYNYAIWQYTNKGTVDGIKGNVDINICFQEF